MNQNPEQLAMLTLPESLLASNTLQPYILNTNEFPIPKPFCLNKRAVKAFLLGADPSNFSYKGATVKLDTVFGIGSGDGRYFRAPLDNLTAIGLHLEDVYVDNLVKNYCAAVTEKNKYWKEIAAHWIDITRKQFDNIDQTKKVPVLLTAGKLYEVLIKEKNAQKHAAYYNGSTDVPIAAELSKLGRPMIPFYRSIAYKLENMEWSSYRKLLTAYFSTER